jgi:CRP-like cAMP-binding protein
MKQLDEILAEHSFFRGLPRPYLELVAGCGKNVRFEAGTFIAREGEDADTFYLIRHGAVALELHLPNQGTRTLQTLGPGDILGWSWLVPPYRWRFDARAVEPTRAIALDGKCLRDKCEADHDLGYALLKRFAYVLGQRLEATRLQLLDVYGAGT